MLSTIPISPIFTSSLASSSVGIWFWGRFCNWMFLPLHRWVLLAPENWNSPLALPSAQVHRSAAWYFFMELFAIWSRSFSMSSASESRLPFSRSLIMEATSFFPRDGTSIPLSSSHPFSCDTEFGFSSPVSSYARFVISSDKARSQAIACCTSSVSIRTPRSLIRWSRW